MQYFASHVLEPSGYLRSDFPEILSMFHPLIISLDLMISKRSVGRRAHPYGHACASQYGERLAVPTLLPPLTKRCDRGKTQR
jgi:hypothetical protein